MTFNIILHNSMHPFPVEDESVSLIVTSPPYSLGKDYCGGIDVERTDYPQFTSCWLGHAYRALRPDGRLAVNIAIDTSRGKEQYPLAFIVQREIEKAGFKYFTTIPWAEGTIGKRSVWGSWLRSSVPYVMCSSEVILVYHKGPKWKVEEKGESGITRDEFLEWTLSPWYVPGQRSFEVGHPAAFPVEIPLRLIKLFTNEGNLVCDPFSGSGSTGVACIRTGRSFVGLEISPQYCAASWERLAKESLNGGNV